MYVIGQSYREEKIVHSLKQKKPTHKWCLEQKFDLQFILKNAMAISSTNWHSNFGFRKTFREEKKWLTSIKINYYVDFIEINMTTSIDRWTCLQKEWNWHWKLVNQINLSNVEFWNCTKTTKGNKHEKRNTLWCMLGKQLLI